MIVSRAETQQHPLCRVHAFSSPDRRWAQDRVLAHQPVEQQETSGELHGVVGRIRGRRVASQRSRHQRVNLVGESAGPSLAVGFVASGHGSAPPQRHDLAGLLALDNALDVIAPARERVAHFLDQGVHLIDSADPAIHT